MTRAHDLELEKEMMTNDGYNTGFDYDLPTSFVTPYQIGVGLGHVGGALDAYRRADPILVFDPTIKRAAETDPLLPRLEPPLPTVSVQPPTLPLLNPPCGCIGSCLCFRWS